ncbi:hypothetical protein QN277_017054 [Acacia crassicarpa]|uniref:RNase H type-1 domain-containing protein n=1 Tax=Acacia crassicarpa TaxID=499986 RepID=A0AAE1MRC1_9FABA|nr:hypothetical protein QN277_017054 [Acacia crassicarpa]
MHNRLLTNVSRCKRGLSDNGSCQICNMGQENLLHVIRDCPETLELWRQIVPRSLWRTFSSLTLDSWMRWNLNYRVGSKQEEDWKQVFAITCWWLWRRRNSTIFENKKISNLTVLSSVMATRCCLNEARDRFRVMNGLERTTATAGALWKSPPPGWVKLNTDGAFSPLSPGIAAGGIVRDEHGAFLRAFCFKGAEGSNLTAELWGCLLGLKLAWDMGCKCLVLEVDSTDVMELLRCSASETHEDRQLIEEVKAVIARNWKVEIQHISRWGNTAADQLAKASLSAMPGFHLVTAPDTALARILENDRG